MDINKIIREELENFDWVREVKSIPTSVEDLKQFQDITFYALGESGKVYSDCAKFAIKNGDLLTAEVFEDGDDVVNCIYYIGGVKEWARKPSEIEIYWFSTHDRGSVTEQRRISTMYKTDTVLKHFKKGEWVLTQFYLDN